MTDEERISAERRWSAVDLTPSRADLLRSMSLGNWEIKPWENYTSANPPVPPGWRGDVEAKQLKDHVAERIDSVPEDDEHIERVIRMMKEEKR